MSDKYGNDIMLNDGDFFVDTDGDLFTSSDYEKKNSSTAKFDGYYNILFSITDRLLTVKGDNPFHPEYGSEVFNSISRPNSPGLKSRISDSIREALLEDKRVAEVQSVTVEQSGDKVYSKAKVRLAGKDTVSEFIFPYFVVQ